MNDQSLIPLFVAGSLLITLFAFFLIAYLLVQKRKQNKYLLEKQQMEFDHENNILRSKLEEHEYTIDQISTELHDNIKSVLGFAQMSMYQIESLAASEKQAILISDTNAIIGKAVDDLHNISHSLNSNFVKHFGLIDTITKDLEKFRESKNIASSIEVKGEEIPLPHDKQLHIYHIAQEAIQNCIKHAKATKIGIIFQYEPDNFRMEISDNGIGFDKNKMHEMKGLGFLSMLQRAKYINGTLDIQSSPSLGSVIHLKVNLI
jgi:two-component system NarL family sensor kinase